MRVRSQTVRPVAPILDALERFHGVQSNRSPGDPFQFLIWWQCGYPPSEERCARGWTALNEMTSVSAPELLAARPAELARALACGGLIPRLRAARVREIARMTQEQFGGDLRRALEPLPAAEARKLLKRFPGIGLPGADRILLFAAIAPVAAVPSACPHVLPRIVVGREAASYTASYRQAQQLIESQVAATVAARSRSYLLLGRHGRELCKARNPKCGQCPIAARCAYLSRPRARVRQRD